LSRSISPAPAGAAAQGVTAGCHRSFDITSKLRIRIAPPLMTASQPPRTSRPFPYALRPRSRSGGTRRRSSRDHRPALGCAGPAGCDAVAGWLVAVAAMRG
jgi:hypothetical protein